MSGQASLASYFKPASSPSCAETVIRRQQTSLTRYLSTSTPSHAPSGLAASSSTASARKQMKHAVGRPRKRTRSEDSDDSDCVIVEPKPDKVDRRSASAEAPHPDDEPLPPKHSYYRSYKQSQRQAIVAYAQKYSIQNAVETYGVPRTTLRGWMAMDFTGPITKKERGRVAGGGRKMTYSCNTEDEILEWVLRQRDLQMPVSRESIKSIALAKVSKENPNFKASHGWLEKFMQRHSLTLRAKTSVAQKLPANLEEKLAGFHSQVLTLRREINIEQAFIGNMDETPVYFDMVPSKTVDRIGVRTVSIRTTGAEKRHFTVVLACTASGELLPPMVIFKGKRALKGLKYPRGWVVTVQEKGWMNEQLMYRWNSDIWERYLRQAREEIEGEDDLTALLTLDSFRAHTKLEVLEAIGKSNTKCVVIPGGCTSKVQPLDVCVNRPFKSLLYKQWMEYMRNKADEAGTDRIRTADKQTVLNWLIAAWEELRTNKELIVKSFLVCGISQSLYGLQDDMVRNEDLLQDVPDEYPDEDDPFDEVDENTDPFDGFEIYD